jgi:hypothetical protein
MQYTYCRDVPVERLYDSSGQERLYDSSGQERLYDSSGQERLYDLSHGYATPKITLHQYYFRSFSR